MKVLQENPDWSKTEVQAEVWSIMTKGVKGDLRYLRSCFDHNYDSVVDPRERRRRKAVAVSKPATIDSDTVPENEQAEPAAAPTGGIPFMITAR
jgi:hypothetical protein